MGLFDNITDKIAENSDQIKEGVEKAGDFVDEKTGNKFEDKVDKAQDFVNDQVDKLAGKDES